MAVNGVVGFAGLPVTMATLGAGRRLALANKESLIAAGPVVRAVRRHPGRRAGPGRQRALRRAPVPACRRGHPPAQPGGAHRLRRSVPWAAASTTWPRSPSTQALAHPTWSMGPKITVDSSTLMNKGLEVIEAHELFDVDYDDIDVVVHPQSIVHSMAEFSDGTTIAQLSMPDMRLPIGYALAYPDRIGTPFGRMDWTEPRARSTFEPPDRATFRLPGPGLPGGTQRADRAGLAVGGQRGRGRRLPGRSHRLGRRSPSWWRRRLDAWDGAAADSLDAVLDADRRGRAPQHDCSPPGASTWCPAGPAAGARDEPRAAADHRRSGRSGPAADRAAPVRRRGAREERVDMAGGDRQPVGPRGPPGASWSRWSCCSGSTRACPC